jgi:hypothetical protein
MICELPGRHFSLRMFPRSSLRRVRPGPGLGHRGRVASRERFSERLVEVCILFGLLLRLGLGFLGTLSGRLKRGLRSCRASR